MKKIIRLVDAKKEFKDTFVGRKILDVKLCTATEDRHERGSSFNYEIDGGLTFILDDGNSVVLGYNVMPFDLVIRRIFDDDISREIIKEVLSLIEMRYDSDKIELSEWIEHVEVTEEIECGV